jgi:hypothetical protein
MNKPIQALAIAAFIGVSGISTGALADHKAGHSPSSNSAVAFAPGQNKAPGQPAKDNAPGQMMKDFACVSEHGASCWAPGHRKKISLN